MADNIKKIPPRKDVAVVVTYTYKGLRGKNGSGPTRSGEDDFAPRQSATKSAAQRYMELIADGLEAGGKKIDKILKSSRDRLRDKLSQIRDDMKSLSASIASALTPDAFGLSDIAAVMDEATGALVTPAQSALQQMMAQLTGTNTALANIQAIYEQLKGSVSKNFLSTLMQSGNLSLIQQLGNDPAAAAQASALFDANAGMANSLGDQTAQQVMGDKIDRAIREEITKLRDDIKDLPDKQANKLAKLLGDLLRDLWPGKGKNAGQGAHERGAW